MEKLEDPRPIAANYKSAAKTFWSYSKLIQFLAVIISCSLASGIITADALSTLFGFAILTSFSILFSVVSNKKRVIAEDIKRQAEFFTGLGIEYDVQFVMAKKSDLTTHRLKTVG